MALGGWAWGWAGGGPRGDPLLLLRWAGSAEERSVYKKACSKLPRSSGPPRRPSSALEDAASPELITRPELYGKFKLAQPPMLGKDIDLILTLANLSRAPKTVTINLSVSSVLYTRTAVQEILKETMQLIFGSQEGERHSGPGVTTGRQAATGSSGPPWETTGSVSHPGQWPGALRAKDTSKPPRAHSHAGCGRIIITTTTTMITILWLLLIILIVTIITTIFYFYFFIIDDDDDDHAVEQAVCAPPAQPTFTAATPFLLLMPAGASWMEEKGGGLGLIQDGLSEVLSPDPECGESAPLPLGPWRALPPGLLPLGFLRASLHQDWEAPATES